MYFFLQSNTSLPSLQSFAAYFLLFLCFSTAYIVKNGLDRPKTAYWKYFLIALLDVEGNFCIILAFRYTAITSVSLLNCSTALFVALFSWKFLDFKFRWYHVVFMAVTICGLVLLVLTDVFFTGASLTEGRPWKELLLGDMFVVLGCFFYSIENVSQERIVKEGTTSCEYLALFGFNGFVICTAQGLAVDWKGFKDVLIKGRHWKVCYLSFYYPHLKQQTFEGLVVFHPLYNFSLSRLRFDTNVDAG